MLATENETLLHRGDAFPLLHTLLDTFDLVSGFNVDFDLIERRKKRCVREEEMTEDRVHVQSDNRFRFHFCVRVHGELNSIVTQNFLASESLDLKK